MTNDFLYAIWFFVPAGFANMAPVLVVKLPGLRDWNTPLDFGRSVRGRRVFGDNKTWRGLICATIVGGLTFSLQQYLAPHLGSFSAYLTSQGYTQLPLVTGCLLGAGALIGDTVESFVKRQCGIPPGHRWFPFDQIDYILGACLLAAPIIVLPLRIYAWIAVIWFALVLVVTYLGYRLDLKEHPI